MEHDLKMMLIHSGAFIGGVAEQEQTLSLGFYAGRLPPFLTSSQNIYSVYSSGEPVELPPDYRKLKRPKGEPLDEENTVPTIGDVNRFNPVFQSLPGLQSLETGPDLMEDYLFQLGFSCCLSLIKGYRFSYSSPVPPSIPLFPHPPPAVSPLPHSSFHEHRLMSVKSTRPSSQASRLGRKRVSERIKLLAGLMPWKRKLDIATMLGKAQRYVKFLQAQVAVLEEMPFESHWPVQRLVECRGMDELSRQELLQLLVNSPSLQEKLCSLGVCVFSMEQLILLSYLGRAGGI